MRSRKVNIYTCISLTFIVLVAGCATDSSIKKGTESSASAIRAAEELGAYSIPNAAYYLQLAKEEFEHAQNLIDNHKKAQAASMLARANIDAEVAVMLAHEESEKKNANEAIGKVRELQENNQLLNN